MGSNKGKRFPVDPPTREEMSRLFEACNTETWIGLRDQCLLALLYRLGLRCNEALTVQLQDVRRRPGGMTVRVMNPKGWDPKPRKDGKERRPARPRELGLDPKSQAIVEAWLAVRGDAPGPLICTQAGGRVLTAHVRRLVPRLARLAGITRRIHPHAMRHAFAGELLEEGADLKKIQLLMGHNFLRTTAGYVEGLVPSVMEVTTAREW
jgi:site-specific recombinase XerD